MRYKAGELIGGDVEVFVEAITGDVAIERSDGTFATTGEAIIYAFLDMNEHRWVLIFMKRTMAGYISMPMRFFPGGSDVETPHRLFRDFILR